METTKTLHLKFGPHAVCLATEFLACRKVGVILKKKKECVQTKQGQKDNTSEANIQNGSQKDSRRTANGWRKESKRKNHLKEKLPEIN